MILVNQPQKKGQETGGSKVFMELKGICMSLGMSKPPPNITMFQFFSGIEKKVRFIYRRFVLNVCGHIGSLTDMCRKPLCYFSIVYILL